MFYLCEIELILWTSNELVLWLVVSPLLCTVWYHWCPIPFKIYNQGFLEMGIILISWKRNYFADIPISPQNHLQDHYTQDGHAFLSKMKRYKENNNKLREREWKKNCQRSYLFAVAVSRFLWYWITISQLVNKL